MNNNTNNIYETVLILFISFSYCRRKKQEVEKLEVIQILQKIIIIKKKYE